MANSNKTPRVHEVRGATPDRAPYHVKQDLGKPAAAKRLDPPTIHPGMTEQQKAMDGTRHLIDGAPDASSANPLDTLSTSQMGKRNPPTMVHDGMTKQQIAGATFNGEQILREGVGLPPSTTEK